MIAADARVVVIGDSPALQQLQEHTGDFSGQLAWVSPGELLSPYDKQTESGEASQRKLEHLYASLRNKIVVRLLVANLNPGHVKCFPTDPIAKLVEDWREIARRRKDLLNDAANEGMIHVTIVVAKEGDWQQEHTAPLRSLAGHSDVRDATGSETTAPHRCYLMTRILELGTTEPVHALEAWPILVADLVGFIVRASAIDRGSHLLKPGLYAWRSLRVVTSVDADVLESAVAEVRVQVNERLLKTAGDELFPEPLPLVPRESVGALFEPPSAAQEAVADLGKTEWMRVGLSQLERVAAAAGWLAATRHFAASIRAATSQLDGKPAGYEREMVLKRMGSAMEVPGHIFPSPRSTATQLELPAPGAAYTRIRAAMAKAERAQEQLLAGALQHQRAARAFVTSSERMVIGLILSMALTYVAVVTAAAASDVLPDGVVSWIDGAWLALWSVAGVAVTLGVGHLLHRWRGESAKDGELRVRAGQFLKDQSAVRTVIAESLSQAAARAALLWRGTARRLLGARLARTKTVLQNELQPLAAQRLLRTDHVNGDREERLRRLIEVKIPGATSVGSATGALVDHATSSFLQEWRKLLQRDIQRVGFLPVSALLQICSNHVTAIKDSASKSFHDASRQKLKWDQAPAINEIGSKVRTAMQSGPAARFFSVDMPRIAAPMYFCWTLEPLVGAFNFLERRSAIITGVESFREPDLLAAVYGEVEITCVADTASTRLQFEPERYS